MGQEYINDSAPPGPGIAMRHSSEITALTPSSLCGEDDGPALPRVKKPRLGFKKGYETTAKSKQPFYTKDQSCKR